MCPVSCVPFFHRPCRSEIIQHLSCKFTFLKLGERTLGITWTVPPFFKLIARRSKIICSWVTFGTFFFCLRKPLTVSHRQFLAADHLLISFLCNSFRWECDLEICFELVMVAFALIIKLYTETTALYFRFGGIVRMMHTVQQKSCILDLCKATDRCWWEIFWDRSCGMWAKTQKGRF